MHLREAYQRRIQDTNKQSQIRKQSQKQMPVPIGSIRSGRINFSEDYRFFDDYQVKGSVKLAKNQMKQLINPDILQLNKKKWNISVEVPKKYEDDESQRAKLLKVKLGFSDYGGVDFNKPKKIYQGTETRDSFTNWNVSTLITKKQKDKGQQNANLNAFENTIKKNNSLVNYQRPIQRYQKEQVQKKNEFLTQSDALNSFKDSFNYQYPTASPERINAASYKFFDQLKRQSMRTKLSDFDTQDSFKSNFKANLTKAQKQKISIHYFHNGKWEKIKQNKDKKTQDSIDEDQNRWSCCMNGRFDSRGCSKKVIDKNRSNYSSPSK